PGRGVIHRKTSRRPRVAAQPPRRATPGRRRGARVPSGLAEDAVQLGAADRALALRHATTRRGHLDAALRLTLLLALHAVELALVRLSHADLRSPQGRTGSLPCVAGPRRRSPSGRAAPSVGLERPSAA